MTIRSAAKQVGLPLLVVCVAVLIALTCRTPASTATEAEDRTDWPKNAKGQTYGNGGHAKSLEDEPDLMAVWATNGELGYAYRTDLEEPSPSSPEEALRQQAENAGKDKVIPVYEADGETQIGVFVIQGSNP